MTTDSPSPRKHPQKPPVPGDLFVLRATAGLPVEWALLERGSGGRFLAVPADAGPPAGTADVEVPTGSPGGPLSLRCRFSLWLDASLLDLDLRSGTLAPEIVEEARFRIRQIESENLAGAPLAEEIDVDSEYRDWIRDVPEQAIKLASTVRPEKKSSSRFPWYGARLLAAAFSALSIGLSFWVVTLQREVISLQQPDGKVDKLDVEFGLPVRGPESFDIRKGTRKIVLNLAVDFGLGVSEGFFEIRDARGKLVYRTEVFDLRDELEFPVVVPRSLMPDGQYRIQLFPPSGGEALDEITLTLRTKEDRP